MKQKRYICFGCFRIVNEKTHCQKSVIEWFAAEPYHGTEKSGTQVYYENGKWLPYKEES